MNLYTSRSVVCCFPLTFAALLASAALASMNSDDIEALVPPGYILIEGDIIVPEDFYDLRSSYTTDTWPGGVVPYEFDDNVTEANRMRMRAAMDDWESRADVQFIPRMSENDYVHVLNAGVNTSYVGMIGGRQDLTINAWYAHDVLVHELGHALAFWHEQSRLDRDQYVQINWDNIQPNWAYAYDTHAGSGVHGPYDFLSVMHYDDCDFSVCCSSGQTCDCDSNCFTMTVLPPYEEYQKVIGQANGISLGDSQGMGFLYGFSGPDCNSNHIRDQVDLATGYSEDCDLDLVPDECILDCNANLVPDTNDIAAGLSPDQNGNGLPDECEQIRLFVSEAATGHDNGTDWTNAFTSVQRALRTAQRGRMATEIWLAAGVYTPEHCVVRRTDSFVLMDGLTIYGGFEGNEDPATFNLADRDFIINQSILSGDIGRDDASGGDTSDNVYHVVDGSGAGPTAVLDGVTITGGNADGLEPRDTGGGVYIVDGNPTLRHCLITGNTATGWGGGLKAVRSDVLLEECTFVANRGENGGGAAFEESTAPAISRCLFKNNTASSAGAIYNYSGGVLRVSDSRFLNNTSPNSTGAIGNLLADAVITNCVFSKNSFATMSNIYSSPLIVNCVFHGVPGFFAGAMLTADGSYPVVVNSIIWDAGGEPIFDANGGSTTVIHSIMQTGWSGDGHNVLNQNPLFRDPLGPDGVLATGDEDFRLQANSPAIDTGTNGMDFDPFASGRQPLPATDLDGHARVLCGTVDMGPYETGLGDHNCDRAVTRDDYPGFFACFTGPPIIRPQDYDADGDVDARDFSAWALCLAGPGAAQSGNCNPMDTDEDGDVDLLDFATVQLAFTGEPTLPPPNCDFADTDLDRDIDLSDFAVFQQLCDQQ